MKIKQPCIITPRLLPGFQLGDTFVSIDYSDRPGDNGRNRYEYHIDAPAWTYTGDDLQSGCGGGSLQAGLASLCSFLSACAESRAYACRTGGEGENEDLFPENVGEWAESNSDELSMIGMELDEDEDQTIIDED